MNYQEFRSLVTKMRCAQKAYFRTKDGAKLNESKRLEHEVDKALEEVMGGQRKMFEEAETK